MGNLGLVEQLFKAIGDLISFYLSERMALVFTSFSPVFTRWWPLYLRDLHSVQEDRERQREKLRISGVCPLLESTQRCSIERLLHSLKNVSHGIPHRLEALAVHITTLNKMEALVVNWMSGRHSQESARHVGRLNFEWSRSL